MVEPSSQANPESLAASGGGQGEVRQHEFESKVFHNVRTLRVWLPPGYGWADDAARQYPVLYLNDGQNLFDPATAYAGVDWRVGQAGANLIRRGSIPPMIVVGIDHAGGDRIKEFIPFPSMHPLVLNPHGRRYPKFLIQEVMPFMQREYRVAQGPGNTGLGGSSLGAAISLYTAMVWPGVFGRLLVESPSLHVGGRQLLKHSRLVRLWPERVFLGIGSEETGHRERDEKLVSDVQSLANTLRRAGLKENRLKVWVEDGAGHNEGAWAHRFPGALEFLFRDGI
jgi:enterochelin esterase-like enzyme